MTRVDYKRELNRLKTDDGKSELLADVCSFANAYGGHLLLGINAKKGVPSGIVGVECDDADAEILRMADLIRAWSEPRLDAHSFKIAAVQGPSADDTSSSSASKPAQTRRIRAT